MWGKLVASRVFTVAGTLALALCAFILYLKFAKPSPPVATNQVGPVYTAPPPPKAKVKYVYTQGPERIVYIEKQPLSASLKMPELLFTKDNVIAVAEVAPHRGKTTAIATIGPDSDNVWRGGILLRQEPPPFFELKREARIGAFLGNGGVFQGELAIRPLRIGPVDVVGKVSGTFGDGTNDYRAYVGAEIQFGF